MRVKTPMGLERFEVGKKFSQISQSLGFTKELVFSQNKTLQFFSGPGVDLYQKLIWYN